MRCLDPRCPMEEGAPDWSAVAQNPAICPRAAEAAELQEALEALPELGVHCELPTQNKALLKRLLQQCPCLYTQVDIRCSAEATVHLCEITLAAKIKCQNVHEAFLVQHPKKPEYPYEIQPRKATGAGGDVMELLCSEVLSNEGIQRMALDDDGWPQWQMPGHINLNSGKMVEVKAFGDILVPCAPTNIVISVKSEAARERLLYSANMIEGVGFGFFNEPKEFWTASRMNLYKRMGFTAIYLPKETLMQIENHITEKALSQCNVNINGNPLYRPLEGFGADMRGVVGRTTLHL
jgi:hypothetical protein